MKKISDFNNATEKYPVIYAGSATRPEYVDMPTTLQQQEGVAPMDTCPAQWWNAMWKLATKDINAFRDYVGDAITEINNLLTDFGITLDDADSEQLYDFFHDTYVQNYLGPKFVSTSGDTIDGDLHIKGDLSVDGIGEEIISTELKVGANTITLRNDNPSALGNTELAGVVTENYDGNNHNNIIAINKNGVARVGDIDIATRILYSNDGTNFYTDETLETPATIGVDEEVRDTGNQTSGGVEIYEGITYSNDNTQAIATREDNPVDGAFMRWDAATKSLVSASASVQFDIAWPIGVVYTQYPGCKSPNELWGDYSTWVELDYSGAFFRANGGSADAFENSLTVSFVSGTTLIFTSAHGLIKGSIVYDSENNESRIVASVTDATTVVLDSAFTDGNLSKVLVSQTQGTAKNGLTVSKSGSASGVYQEVNTDYTDVSHAHGIGGNSNYSSVSGSANVVSMNTGGGWANSGATAAASINHRHTLKFTPSVTDNISVALGAGDSETRPNNFTKKVWKRIA